MCISYIFEFDILCLTFYGVTLCEKNYQTNYSWHLFSGCYSYIYFIYILIHVCFFLLLVLVYNYNVHARACEERVLHMYIFLSECAMHMVRVKAKPWVVMGIACTDVSAIRVLPTYTSIYGGAHQPDCKCRPTTAVMGTVLFYVKRNN